MRSKKMLTILVVALGLAVCPTEFVGAATMDTAITYQGRLMDANEPAEGLYDFVFILYNEPNDGNQVGLPIPIDDHGVKEGYFKVELDFGSGVFDGNNVWLEIGIRAGELDDPNLYTILSPRQKVTPVPYAMYALEAVTVQQAQSGIVPKGGIIMWAGSINDIPPNWALCDGTNGTPDLTSRFIRSVPDNSTNPGSIGGSLTHSHGAGTYTASAHTHSFSGTTGSPSDTTQRGDKPEHCASTNHTHTYSGTTDLGGGGDISGTSGEGSNLPLYYELAFIMKL